MPSVQTPPVCRPLVNRECGVEIPSPRHFADTRARKTSLILYRMSSEEGESVDEVAPEFLSAAIAEATHLGEFVRGVGAGFALTAELPGVIGSLRKGLPEPLASRFAELQQRLEELQPFAARETDSGQTYLLALATVRLVSILETVVSDAVAASLSRPEILERPEIRRVKAPLAEFIEASEEERLEYFAAAIAQETRVSLKESVARYETLLQSVGLAGELHNVAKRVLFELLQVRNVIVHRAGRVDKRLLLACPWLSVRRGELLLIQERMFIRYRTAVGYYLLEILRRWANRDGRTFEQESAFIELWSHALRELTADGE